MRNPERDSALDSKTQFAKFTIIKAVVVSDEHKFRFFDRRAQIEARVLRRKPFIDFRVRKEENILDIPFVDCI